MFEITNKLIDTMYRKKLNNLTPGEILSHINATIA